MTTAPDRLRDDPASPPALLLALRDGHDELPSDLELGALRERLAERLGEPLRLKEEAGFAGQLEAIDDGPSSAELEALRARLAREVATRVTRSRKPGRRAAVVLALLLPAAAAAYWLGRAQDSPAPAPSVAPSVVGGRAPFSSSSWPRLEAPSLVPSMSPSVPPPAPSLGAIGSIGSSGSSPRSPSSRSERPADVPDELSLLREAQQALNGNPGLALELASRHARLYPRGTLVEEREVLAIDALARLGRLSEARARARRFSERHAGSAHWPRLERKLFGQTPAD